MWQDLLWCCRDDVSNGFLSILMGNVSVQRLVARMARIHGGSNFWEMVNGLQLPQEVLSITQY